MPPVGWPARPGVVSLLGTCNCKFMPHGGGFKRVQETREDYTHTSSSYRLRARVSDSACGLVADAVVSTGPRPWSTRLASPPPRAASAGSLISVIRPCSPTWAAAAVEVVALLLDRKLRQLRGVEEPQEGGLEGEPPAARRDEAGRIQADGVAVATAGVDEALADGEASGKPGGLVGELPRKPRLLRSGGGASQAAAAKVEAELVRVELRADGHVRRADQRQPMLAKQAAPPLGAVIPRCALVAEVRHVGIGKHLPGGVGEAVPRWLK
eukprot:scaffold41446_cov64-Phaeocystis_antarctica.AAC.3